MPLAEEKLPEKNFFDVYAMALIVTAVLTVTACVVLHMELTTHWTPGAWRGTNNGHPGYLSVLNDQKDVPAGKKPCDWVVVTEEDLKDYKAITGDDLKVEAYPGWMDPRTASIDLEPDHELAPKLPDAERQDLAKKYLETDGRDPTKGTVDPEVPK